MLYLNDEVWERVQQLSVIGPHLVAANAMIPPRFIIVSSVRAERCHNGIDVVRVLAARHSIILARRHVQVMQIQFP